MQDSQSASIVLTGAAVAIIGRLLAAYDKRERRKEALEARRMDQIDQRLKAAAIKAELQAQAERVAHVTRAQAGEVMNRIQEVSEGLQQNTIVNVKALDSGNNFNVKLDKVHARIDAVVEDVNATVRPIKEAIAKIQQQLS